jgi:hypothetical protein
VAKKFCSDRKIGVFLVMGQGRLSENCFACQHLLGAVRYEFEY